MIEKKNIRQDAETQCLEDVICHVFLLHYAESFSEKHEAAKIIDILEKTWKKLSDRGKTHVNELSISEAVSGFLSKAELS